MSTFIVAHRVVALSSTCSMRAGGAGSVSSILVREQQPPLSTVLAYMQLLEDYSEPQPSMFYQTPQSEHIYQQKNKMLMEVYGFSDSFCSSDSTQELAPPPALPPKQRQLVSSSLSVSLALGQGTRASSPTSLHEVESGPPGARLNLLFFHGRILDLGVFKSLCPT